MCVLCDKNLDETQLDTHPDQTTTMNFKDVKFIKELASNCWL